MFKHLGLQRWPFNIVPSPELCDYIADREQIRKDIDNLLRNLSRQNTSSIHTIWSWFGAGKTHTLHYISNKATQIHSQHTSILRTVYSEFPQSPRSFVDIYKCFVFQLDQKMLSEAYAEIYTSPESAHLSRNLSNISPDLVSALNVLVVGNSIDQQSAMRWIRAEALPVSECRRLGITKRISSSEESSRNLIALVRLFGLSAGSQNKINSRIVWLLDELQRIESLPLRLRDEINTGLHSTFNACPSGFTMILSLSGQPKEKLPEWISPELKDRIGRTKVMILPPMEVADALKFVADVLAHARTPESAHIDPYFPFSEATCLAIIEEIRQNDELKPRAIMQVFNEVLLEADSKIEAREINVITPEFAKTVLAELVDV